MKYKDYYKTLGVSREATPDEIQRAYRKLARQYHPDINKSKSAEEKFKEINEANEVLSDPQKRRRYDALGADWRAGQDFRPPPGFENVSFHFGAGREGSQGFGFSDFFEAVFGGGFEDTADFFGAGRFGPGGMSGFEQGSAFRPEPDIPGQSHHAEMELSVEDIYRGASKHISLETLETDAHGRTSRKIRNYEIKIPPGTSEGSAIRLAGQGGRGHGGAKAGDLLLRVKILPHPRFKVAGYDLITPLPLTPWEAALGGKVDFKLIDDEVKIAVPAGSQSGERLRLKGKGLPVSQSRRGDLYAELAIVLPKKLSPEERALFEKLAGISKFKPRG